MHRHPTPTPDGSPVTDRALGQAGRQGSISPSTSHPGAIDHSHTQHTMLPFRTCFEQQPGAPMVLKQQCQDAPAAGLAPQGNQVCCDEDQSLGSFPYPSHKAGQASQQPWGREVHAAAHARSSRLPQAQPLRPAVSCLGPSYRPQCFTAQPELSYQSPKVRFSHDFFTFACNLLLCLAASTAACPAPFSSKRLPWKIHFFPCNDPNMGLHSCDDSLPQRKHAPDLETCLGQTGNGPMYLAGSPL